MRGATCWTDHKIVQIKLISVVVLVVLLDGG